MNKFSKLRMPIILLFGAGLMAMPVATFAETLIVGNKREHTVSFIDLASGDEVRRIATGKAPHEVAVSPDGKTAVVVSYRGQGFTSNTLHVFDVLSGENLNVIDLGEHEAPHGLKWIGESNKVAVTTEQSKHLVIVDIAEGKIVQTSKTDQRGSHMVALSPDLSRAYVAGIGSGTFTVHDLETGNMERVVKAGSGTEAISVTPDGMEIWVGNNNSKNVMVFDAENFKRLATIPTEGVPIRVEVSPDGKVVAVSEPDLNQVTILDAVSREVITRIDLTPAGAKVPVTMLFSETGDRLWVATTQAARVIELDTSDWSIIRSLSAGEGSDGLGFSPLSIVPVSETDAPPAAPPE